MYVISLHEIVACNEILKEKGLPYRIHLRDACGKQSCYIESLDKRDEKQNHELTQVYEILEEYFGKLRIQLEYSEDQENFWINSKNK